MEQTHCELFISLAGAFKVLLLDRAKLEPGALSLYAKPSYSKFSFTVTA